MAMRVVDGPGGGQLISREDACRWLGLGYEDEEFDALLARHPWCRPVTVGTLEMFGWLDVFVLGHLVSREALALRACE
jgi:hypothetical protein